MKRHSKIYQFMGKLCMRSHTMKNQCMIQQILRLIESVQNPLTMRSIVQDLDNYVGRGRSARWVEPQRVGLGRSQERVGWGGGGGEAVVRRKRLRRGWDQWWR
ncbi:hypothetical protein QJS10_CPA16g00251 [Acorus calamus]|uniref:Uncharacterized protein n=1 Tax=Acorus calamus TaxID=4465 RepID=A0AAV9D0A1_ACOCL|nr:hypothetical protein QJS10_CPA16g00251 [Acorus calamus]